MGEPEPSERWRRVKELFAAALEVSPEEREALLARASAEDAPLASEAASLLRAHEDGGLFLEDVVAFESREIIAEESGTSWVGRRIGPYEIVRPLGRGGMGFVFLARRADSEYRGDVAIKLIRGALPSEEILRRFRAERQTLANLSHPSIARLLDGGRTDDGLPYLVLEHVDGEPIDAYCESRRLPIEETLRLFRLVCDAVEHAHRHLVVHRDLKPANIFVTPDGGVKLLDFGIAKLLPGAGQEETSILTRTSERVMTPEYASPEQIRGEPVTTASDVYALGVLLYRLLAGRHPYRFPDARPSEVERVICEQEPVKPSTAVTRQPDSGGAPPEGDRGLPPSRAVSERLRRRLRGDLDNIVLKALRKEPWRRYGSVDQLSEDIRRHLEGLPVRARQDTLGYRTGKFLRRNRLAVTAAAVVVLALLAGLATTAWQARVAANHARRAEAERARADRRFNEVRQLATAFLFDFHDAIADLPGSTPARELVVARALEYLDRLSRESPGDDPVLLRELAVAYQKIGNVQGNPNNANLGDTESALASYRKALAIARPLAASHPADAQAQRVLAIILEKLADVEAVRGDIASARRDSAASLSIFRALARGASADGRARRSVAISHVKAGDLSGHPSFPNAGLPREALAHYERAAPILESLVQADPSDGGSLRYLGLVFERIGTMRLQLAQPREALTAYRRSFAIREKLAAGAAANVEARRDVAIAHERIADASRALGRPREALSGYRRSVAIMEALAAADPRNANARRSVASSYEQLGEALMEYGDLREAWSFHRRAVVLREDLAADADNVQAQRELADSLREAAGVADRRGDDPGAADLRARAERIERTVPRLAVSKGET